MVSRDIAVLALACAAFMSPAVGQESTLHNPTRCDCRDEVIRLATPAPGPAGSFVVREEGREIPYFVEQRDGKNETWVLANLPAGAMKTYQVAAGRPASCQRKVTVKKRREPVRPRQRPVRSEAAGGGRRRPA